MAIGPVRLEGIATDQLPAHEVKARGGIAHVRPRDIAENIRLAAARRARTGAPKTLQGQIRFQAIVPLDGELVTDQLHILQLYPHGSEARDIAREIKSTQR